MLRHIEPQPLAGRSPAHEQNGPAQREWYRPFPPYKEVVWSMRDNTNYMETGVLTALELTAAFPNVIVDNFYQKSRNSIQAGEKDAPFGFVIPVNQPDLTRVAFVIKVLRLQGIGVGKAKQEVRLKEGVYPAGSLVIKRNQPYGRLAKILLEKQVYPDPTLRTYDDSAWTMGLMTHTSIIPIADHAVLDLAVETVENFEPEGKISGSTSATSYAIADNGSPNLVTLRYRLKDIPIRVTEQPFKAGDQSLPAGSFIVPGSAYEKLKSMAEPLGLNAVALTSETSVAMHPLNLPRLAVYSTWGSTQDVGWVRYAFDKYDVSYDLIYKERVKQGNLRNAYDVILIPNQGRTAKGLVFDIEPKKLPLAYEKSDQYKSLGDYGSSPDIAGGMGLEGVVELQKFVQQGGLLVTLGTASSFPPAFGLTRKVEATGASSQFYAPGPIVEADILQPANPVFYGYPDKKIPVRWANGPLLTLPAIDQKQILMSFPGGDASVMSGLMKGANEIRNNPAIVDVPVGQGQVLLFTTNPCYRWQNVGEFRMLFNVLMNYDDLKAPAAGTSTDQ